jgi:hypothetical protein
MTACNGETAPGAVFVDTNVPDLQNLLNGLARGVTASTREDAQEDAKEGAIR